MKSSVPRVPALRIAARNDRRVRARGDYVLYWMTAARRTSCSFALDRAIEIGTELEKPVLVLEPLRVAYRWNSARFHRFVLDGMRANRDACAAAGVAYFPYVEPEDGAGRGLLAALAERAALVVADDWPGMFLPRAVATAAARLAVRLEAVDGNGLLPMRAADATYPSAYAFRRFLQRTLAPHLLETPRADALELASALGAIEPAREILRRWPRADDALLDGDESMLAALPVDRAVGVVAKTGGAVAAAQGLREFVRHRLPRYAENRGDFSDDVASGFSPWLHFGHLSTHAVLDAIGRSEGWTPERVAPARTGRRAGAKDGWWDLSPSAESFLDELVTWRELGFNFASREPGGDRYESLPAWARATLDEHAADPREHVYSLEELERAETHDELWNSAQRQLLREGRIHNYARMLWGKKILEWTRDPRAALEVMIELNNRWALDGRDPNSYSGIFWTLGRYDRPWGPVRKVFGTVRYMSSANTARKFEVASYRARYAATS